jgi:DHA1 family multidrug resistance protein-like MFS transporter
MGQTFGAGLVLTSLRRTVAFLSGTVFLVMIGISIITPDLPQYGQALGATPFLVGVLVGILPATRLALDLPSGAFGDRFGHRFMMQCGLAIIATTSLLAYLSFDYWTLFAVRAMEGIGSAFYVTSSLASLATHAPIDRRGRYMGIYVNALLIGQVVGPVIGGFVVLWWGLKGPFGVYSALAAIGFVLITLGIEPDRRSERPPVFVDFSALRRLLRDRSYMFVSLGVMGTFFIRAGLITTVIPLFIAYNWGVGETLAVISTGVLITTNAGASLFTLYPSGWLSDRIGRKIPFVSSLVLAGIVSPFLFFATDLTSAIPIMFVYGLALGLHGPLAAWATDLTPREILGPSMGLYRTIGDLGFFLGPFLLGAVAHVTIIDDRVTLAPFLVASAWVIVSALLMLFARDPAAERRRTATTAARPGNST